MANRSKAIGGTARSARFKRASAYYWGAQYDELPSHYDQDSQTLTLRERQPAILAQKVKRAVDTANRYLFGASRLPNFIVTKIPIDDGADERAPETDAERTQLDEVNAQIARIRRWSQLDKYMSEIGRLGLTQGTVALAGLVSDQVVWAEVIEVADCYPKFGRDDRKLAVESDLQEDDLLELVEYWAEVIDAEEADADPTYKIHKRIWTTTETIEHEPLDAETLEDLAPQTLEFVVDMERSVKHDLGFVPVVWIRNKIVANSNFGAALVGEPEFRLEDEINYTATQAGRAVRYAAEPTPILKDCATLSFEDNKIRRGADQTIQITSTQGSPEASVSLLEMQGTGSEAAAAYIASLEKLAEAATGVAEHDPDKALGALSGTALERLMAPLIATINDLRATYGAGLARWFELMLRVYEIEGYTVEAVWPRVVEPSLDDLASIAPSLLMLRDGGVMTRRDVVQILSNWTGADDVDAYLAALDEEAAAGGTSQLGGAPGADPLGADDTLP